LGNIPFASDEDWKACCGYGFVLAATVELLTWEGDEVSNIPLDRGVGFGFENDEPILIAMIAGS
jgi:hypothetical protein